VARYDAEASPTPGSPTNSARYFGSISRHVIQSCQWSSPHESTRLGMPRAIVMRHATPNFQHVFAGDGYSSGYYSYMLSEVMDADAFAAFRETVDVFDPATAKLLVDRLELRLHRVRHIRHAGHRLAELSHLRVERHQRIGCRHTTALQRVQVHHDVVVALTLLWAQTVGRVEHDRHRLGADRLRPDLQRDVVVAGHHPRSRIAATTEAAAAAGIPRAVSGGRDRLRHAGHGRSTAATASWAPT